MGWNIGNVVKFVRELVYMLNSHVKLFVMLIDV